MPVLTDVLNWSIDRPLWQRDALRRIVTSENLSEQDISELLQICLSQYGVADTETAIPAPVPFSANHLPADDQHHDPVRLLALSEVEGVNALASAQRMTFEPTGVTVIFGFNGSGKSGYARILKALGHARHRETRILPNAFSDEQPSPSAAVAFRVENEDRDYHWKQNADIPPDLHRISFFDSDCATVHVSDSNDLAFTPYGLDVLPKLVTACRKLSDQLRQRMTTEEQAKPAPLQNPRAVEYTQTRAALAALGPESRLEEFEKLAQMSDAEQQRITELKEALGNDPGARAQELRHSLARLRRLQSQLGQIETQFGGASVEDIHSRLGDYKSKREAAQIAASRAFDTQPLPGVGSEVWYELWESARKFSKMHSYKEKEFPYTEDQARCVLCLQELQPEAQKRLLSFEEFVEGDTHRLAERAQRKLTDSVNGIEQTVTGFSAFRDCSADLRHGNSEQHGSVILFCRRARQIKRSILGSYEALEWSEPPRLPPVPDVTATVDGLTQRISELEAAARGEERHGMIRELDELLARRWLGEILNDVRMEIVRQQRMEAFESAAQTVTTQGITRKSGDLTDLYVTDVLQNRFVTEVEYLGAGHLPVEFYSAGGQLGHKQFRIKLVESQPDVGVGEILSEGEFRCLALAGFLAELSTEESNSALVFDDPVSSMDHRWRKKVADRFARLATQRQVVVFTHDVVFISDLIESCNQRDVPIAQRHIRRHAHETGECADGLPWHAMKVSKRIAYLRNKHQQAAAIFRREGPELFEPLGREIYGLLRETWERAVEEVLFNGTVMRLDFAVHTQQLRQVHDISQEDVRDVENGMTKSSRYLRGHDDANAVVDPVPEPDEISGDIENVAEWVRRIRERRN